MKEYMLPFLPWSSYEVLLHSCSLPEAVFFCHAWVKEHVSSMLDIPPCPSLLKAKEACACLGIAYLFFKYLDGLSNQVG